MNWAKLLPIAAVLSLAPMSAGADEARPKLDEVVTIELPKDGYTFTLAEAARGVKFEYKIVIKQDYKGVIPLPFGPSYREPAGPSGLYPRESISSDGHAYCLADFGLAPPPKQVVKTLKKGTHIHAVEWDGRNWSGPSDTNRPRGKPFPAGTYDVTVTVHGHLVTDKGNTPYKITGKTKLVLK